MKPSEALVVARKEIVSKRARYICYALPENSGGDVVRRYIKAALGNYGTYGGWLYCFHYSIGRKMTGDQTTKARIQWIDWMIEQYEMIGQ